MAQTTRFDMTPEKMPFRGVYLTLGVLYLVIGGTAIYGKIIDTGTARLLDWMNLTLGILWIGTGVFGHLIQKTTVSWDEDGLAYQFARKRDRITFAEMKQIRMERMKLEIERDGKPFEMDFGTWTYAQNVEAKSPLYEFLREQAQARSIPLTEK